MAVAVITTRLEKGSHAIVHKPEGGLGVGTRATEIITKIVVITVEAILIFLRIDLAV
ncbi:hypothetical protein D3C80_1738200 [compost metagenome]